MIRDIIKKVRRIFGFARGGKIFLLLGISGHAINRFLEVWLIADLLSSTVSACQAGDFLMLQNAVLRALSLLSLILLLMGISTWLCGHATAITARAMRETLFSSLLSPSLQGNNKNHSGTALSYFSNDIPVAVESLIPALTRPVSALFMGLGGLFYVLQIHPVMAGLSVLIGIFTFIYSLFFAGRLHKIAVKRQVLLSLLEIRLRDLLDGMMTVRMFSMRKKLESGMDKTSSALRGTGILWAKVSAALGGLNNFTSTVTDQLLIFTAGLLFLSGSLEMTELLRVSQIAGGIIGVFHISRLLVSVQDSLSGAERVFDYLDTTEPEKNAGKSATLTDTPIIFEQVQFKYAGVLPVLKNLSFSIEKGELITFVGASGNGKSTILRLIQGLYQPASGSIKICGVSLSDWDTKALRKMIALVPQEPVLFPGTIAENISIGLEDISLQEIENAAKKAGAHEFISEMEKGYLTPVSERGMSLSGGQRQRLAIARALLRDTPILLLDEATSAMDTLSEKKIYDTLLFLKGEKTILFVTHRTSALRIADRTITV